MMVREGVTDPRDSLVVVNLGGTVTRIVRSSPLLGVYPGNKWSRCVGTDTVVWRIVLFH